MDVAELIPGAAAVAGVLIAWRSLRTIARARRFDSFTSFSEAWEARREDRDWIRDHFEFDPEAEIDDDTRIRLRRVVNHFHVVALELENGLIRGQDVFPLCYVEILRVMHRLTPWIEHQQAHGHERYGLRVLRLGDRARRYHDSDPARRRTKVRLGLEGRRSVIYETREPSGPAGHARRLGWWMRRLAKSY
ncbi:MAG: hypothetical protein M3340_09550 [Actinomycetota bacterium]|nr:hypothetical protein [Actinomycetota bacterium]